MNSTVTRAVHEPEGDSEGRAKASTSGPRRRSIVERAWYEMAPYVYAFVGLAAGAISSTDVGLLFSALLLMASFTVVRRRRVYRSPRSRHHRKYARPG